MRYTSSKKSVLVDDGLHVRRSKTVKRIPEGMPLAKARCLPLISELDKKSKTQTRHLNPLITLKSPKMSDM